MTLTLTMTLTHLLKRVDNIYVSFPREDLFY